MKQGDRLVGTAGFENDPPSTLNHTEHAVDLNINDLAFRLSHRNTPKHSQQYQIQYGNG